MDYILNRIFDSPIQVAFPDAEWSIPEIGDTTARLPINSSPDAVIYEYAYRRYEDPLYLPIIEKSKRVLDLSSHTGPPGLLYDLDAQAAPKAERKPESINFFDNGIGVLRLKAGDDMNQLILLSGESRSHGHPDKLTIILYALGDVVLPDPGVIFPYQDPLDPTWYSTTLSTCTLTVDEKSQIDYGSLYKYKGATPPVTPQLVFGPAATMGIQRAYTCTCYPGVTMDRSVFATPEYIADLYGAFSQDAHKYDLAWHLRGQLTSDLQFQPMTFSTPVADGYNSMADVRHVSTDKAWSATAERDGKDVRLLAAGGMDTDVIAATGHYRGGIGYGRKDELPPAILERRTKDASTLYGNAVDVSGTKDGYLKAVTQEGGLDKGYGLLQVQTMKGTDLCFTSYRPGTYKAGGMETDAEQAFVLMDGKNVRAMFLAGGKVLKAAGGAIERSEPGLAYVEKTGTGTYIVGNPSGNDATVTVTLPELSGLKGYLLDDKGARKGPASVTNSSPNSCTVELKAASKVEFSQ